MGNPKHVHLGNQERLRDPRHHLLPPGGPPSSQEACLRIFYFPWGEKIVERGFLCGQRPLWAVSRDNVVVFLFVFYLSQRCFAGGATYFFAVVVVLWWSAAIVYPPPPPPVRRGMAENIFIFIFFFFLELRVVLCWWWWWWWCMICGRVCFCLLWCCYRRAKRVSATTEIRDKEVWSGLSSRRNC